MAVATALVLAGCTQQQLQGWVPGGPDVTNNTGRVIGLWTTSWIVLLVVGIITWVLVIWAAVVYRRRRGQSALPVQLRYNMPVEIFYTIVPLILVLGFFAFTARDQTEIERNPGDPDVTIEVYGKRWGWDFNYLNDDVYFQGIQGQVVEGGQGEVAQDQLPVLYLPVNQKVEISLKSRDVIHSFWVIDFLYKKDMIPGKTNYMYFTPTKEGTYAGKCAELCGEYHSLMLFNVEVVSQQEYDAYIESLRAEGNTGRVDDSFNTNTNLPGTGARVEEESE